MHWTTYLSDFDWTSVLVATTMFLAAVYYLGHRRPKNFPPGPYGLPMVGYIPFLGENGADTIMRMKEKYGPVMSMQLGSEYWVILNDFDSINEALVKQGDKFSGRPQNFFMLLITQGYGVFSLDYGVAWKKLKKFGLTTLKGFGVGKKGMEENVIEEMPHLIDGLTTDDSESVKTKLNLAVANIICRIVFGSRFAYDDRRFRILVKLFRDVVSESNDENAIGVTITVPQLRFVPPFKGAIRRVMSHTTFQLDTLRDIIAEHEATFDDNDHRDFIDAFLSEAKKEGKNNHIFSKRHLLQYIHDLFEAGTSTTSSTLSWMMLVVANLPEYQEKIAKEIESAIGESGVPTVRHRGAMPYTCAFVEEIFRHRTLVPLSTFHKTNTGATLNGYAIPKNTTVIPNLWSVHFDPKLFENPEEFRPERFLDENGKFVSSKYVIPFSVGPRHCLGEQLARMEVFIFFTGIVQKLKIVQDPDHLLPPVNSGIHVFLGTYEPPDFKVKFERR